MNPIEHVWLFMKRKLQELSAKPKNIPALKDALLKIWDEMDQSVIQHLISSMPNRVSALVSAGGKSTKY